MTRLGDSVFSMQSTFCWLSAMFRFVMSFFWDQRMRLDTPLWMKRRRRNIQMSHLGF